MITNNLQREIIKKKNFFLFPPGYWLIILYQLTKFEMHTYNTFWDITIINFRSPNLQREINRKKWTTCLIFTRQSIYLSPSISWPSLKLLAITVFKISWLQFSNSKFAMGDNSKRNKIFFSNFHGVIYSSSSFESPYYNTFWDILITNFQNPNLQREIIKKMTFFLFSPGNLRIILYQLTKFEAPSYNTFWDILISNFQSPIKREIIRKKITRWSTQHLLSAGQVWSS